MRLILIIVVILTLILLMCSSGCSAAMIPDELHIYGEMTPLGPLGTVRTVGAGVTYKLK